MAQTYEQNGKKKQVATIVCIAIIALVVILADQLKTKHSVAATTTIDTSTDTPVATATPDTATVATATPAATTASSGYKDGSYSATSTYSVPHGDESIKVTLTLSNGVITNASVANSESDRDSASYQEAFTSEYKSYVVGKKISGLALGNIAGASDTTQGFNDALSQIASKAQA